MYFFFWAAKCGTTKDGLTMYGISIYFGGDELGIKVKNIILFVNAIFNNVSFAQTD